MRRLSRLTLSAAILLALLLITAPAARLGSARSDFAPLVAVPYPYGKTYALSLIDDPDGGSLETTAPVYAFLDALKIKITKCVWMLSADDPDAEWGEPKYSMADPAYRAFALKLAREGHEIAFHGASAGKDQRPRIAAALEAFKATFGAYPRMNADHAKNSENLYFGQNRFTHEPFKRLYRLYDPTRYEGEDENSPYFWGDLARSKIKYHRGFYFSGLDTLAENPSMPYHNPQKDYVPYWYSVTDGHDIGMFLSRLSRPALAALKDRRGASIIYIHFGYGFYDADHKRVDKRFQEVMTGLAKNQELWITPVSDLLDRLLLFKRVNSEAMKHRWTIRNRNGVELRGVTVVDPDRERRGPLQCRSNQKFSEVRPGVYVFDRLGPYSLAILTDAKHAAHLNDLEEISGAENSLLRLEWLWRAIETRL